MSVKAQNLYQSLITDGIYGAKGEINAEFSFGGQTISHKIVRPSSVGEIIEEWLREYMKKKNIYFEAQDREDFPDFFLSRGDKEHDLLEIKTYKKGPAFDIANLNSFCQRLPEHAFILDADYLIINYTMNNNGDIFIKKMFLKKIYQICGKETNGTGLKKQTKKGMKTTIRPIGLVRANQKSMFSDLEDFLHSVYVEYSNGQYTPSIKDKNEWVDKLVHNYNTFVGAAVLHKNKIMY